VAGIFFWIYGMDLLILGGRNKYPELNGIKHRMRLLGKSPGNTRLSIKRVIYLIQNKPKSGNMKTISTYLIGCACVCMMAFISPLGGNAQDPFWPAAMAVTDSATDNLNAVVVQSDYEDLMFWERHVDADNSVICMKDLYAIPLPEAEVLLSQPMTKLTHPVMFNTSYFEPGFFLFYETNEAGNQDIKYIKRNPDGTFAEPATLVAADGDDVNLTADNWGRVAWENGGKVMLAGYSYAADAFTTPMVVDDGEAYSPIFYNDGYQLAWLKRDGLNAYLKFADINYTVDGFQILNRDSVAIDGEAEQLNGSKMLMYGYTNSLSFQKKAAGQDRWSLVFADMQEVPPVLSGYQSASFNDTSPVTWEVPILVKNLINLHAAFVSDSLGNPEIIASAYMFPSFPEYLENVSDYAGIDQHPNVFFALHGLYMRTYLIWESFRNGHWTLCNTFSDEIWGGTGESPEANTVLISPNPFKEQVKLQIRSAALQDDIRILNMQGLCINTLKALPGTEGWSTANWDGRDMRGNKVPAGSYIVVYPKGAGLAGKVIVKTE
jgi:hypothetical protein